MIAEGVALYESDHGTGSAGCIQKTNPSVTAFHGKHKVLIGYNVIVNGNLQLEEKFSIVIHEFGHLFCGHLRANQNAWWVPRLGLTDEIREFEAECVSYLVCKRAGLATTSAEYLACYLEGNDMIPAISIETVLKVVEYIESMAKTKKVLRKEMICEDE